jgi:hypothetical protein
MIRNLWLEVAFKSHMSRRRNSSSRLAAEFGLAGFHTAMTLWYRLPMLAGSYGVAGAGQPEFGRMISEKAAAAIEGAWDAHVEVMRLTGDAMTGRMQFHDVAGAAAQIAAAGLRPAFRRVKANSRRLRRRSAKS